MGIVILLLHLDYLGSPERFNNLLHQILLNQMELEALIDIGGSYTFGVRV